MSRIFDYLALTLDWLGHYVLTPVVDVITTYPELVAGFGVGVLGSLTLAYLIVLKAAR